MAKTEITKYKYDFRNTPGEKVAILLLLNGNDLLSMVAFIDNDEQELPPPRESLNGIVHISYRYKWLKDIIDMLRKEEPVYFVWNANEQVALITTEEEPTGEEERKSLLKYIFG
jgi:hypothetical protein